MNDVRQILCREEVQKVLKMGTNKTLALFKTKGFPSFRIGNRWFVSVNGLNQWLEEQEKNKSEIQL